MQTNWQKGNDKAVALSSRGRLHHWKLFIPSKTQSLSSTNTFLLLMQLLEVRWQTLSGWHVTWQGMSTYFSKVIRLSPSSSVNLQCNWNTFSKYEILQQNSESADSNSVKLRVQSKLFAQSASSTLFVDGINIICFLFSYCTVCG